MAKSTFHHLEHFKATVEQLQKIEYLFEVPKLTKDEVEEITRQFAECGSCLTPKEKEAIEERVKAKSITYKKKHELIWERLIQ